MIRTNELIAGFRKKFSTPEAAEYLGVGKSTLDKLRLNGDGPPFIKLGKRVIYDPADLDAWSSKLKRTSTSPSTAAAA